MRTITPTLRRNSVLQLIVLAALMPSLFLYQTPVQANPSGAVVAAGNVQFNGFGSNNLNIIQNSNRAVINWQSFSIAEGSTTRFVQPNAGSVALNRVVGGNLSEIHGSLRANGGVILVNPNGVVVGPAGTIDVGGLLALSTLDVKNSEFLNGGAMRFRGNTSAGVTNYGAISSQSGDVVLLGNFLHNHGSVSAPSGTVAFGAGGDILMEQTASGATISVVSGGNGSHIDNSGDINGAAAQLKAHGNAYSLAVQNTGVVRASGYNFAGGKLTLSGGQGKVVNTGTLSARNADGSGGRVEVSGGQVSLGGTVDASGEVGRAGGSVVVNGGEVQITEGASVMVGGTEAGRVTVTGEESVTLAGHIDAVGSHGSGGQVDLTAASVVLEGSAAVHATGSTGGSVRIGGGVSGRDPEIGNAQSAEMREGALVIADGTAGDGGSVVLFAEGDTLFQGQISAQAIGTVGNGGFVEVSGQRDLVFEGDVSTRSVNGRTGTLLIDPVDIIIYGSGGGGTLEDAVIRNLVLANNVIIHTAGAGAAQGNITINSGAKIIYDSPNSLTFLAHGSIFVNGDIKNIGHTDIGNTGHITLAAGWDGTLPAVLNDNVSASSFINPDGSRLLASPFGAWGRSGSQIYLNQSGLEAVEVGSARGETNVFADVVTMRHGFAEGRFAQIGYRRVADSRANDPGQFGGFFLDSSEQIVDGDINVSGLSAVRMLPSDQFNADDFNKLHARAYVQIGHGGIRRADDSVDNRGGGAAAGFGYDSGGIFVDDGDNSGDITVYAGTLLDMMGSRLQGHTQIGHGGHGGSTPNHNNTKGLGTVILGDLSGDIRVTAGIIQMEAGLYSDAPVQIGHGGFNVRGEHSGNIEVTSTLGSIRGTAAPNLGDAGPGNPTDWRWTNNRDRSFVMIGHGGSGSFHPNALPVRTIQVNGVDVNGSYGGDGIAINPATGLPYGHYGDITVRSAGGLHFTASGNDAFAKIGHGGNASHGDHRGNIEVVAANGGIVFDRIAIQLDRNGQDRRNVGTGAFVQIGHGGRRSSGGNTGDIAVSATGDIVFIAGRSEAFAQIGHGGRGIIDVATLNSVTNQRNTLYANGSHSGNISVTAGGNIVFRGGFGTGGTAFAMIGNGGYRQYADVLEQIAFPGETPFGGGATRILVDANGNPILDVDGKYQLVPDETQQGHNGDIVVTAGGNVDFRAGQVQGEELVGQEPFGIEMNRNQNFVQIGNGGDESWGDHWGNITVDAGGHVIMEGRGGWDGVSIESTDAGPAGNPLDASLGGRATPRLGTNEDNSTTGIRNYAMIGNGGFNAHHRNNAQPAHRDGTGKIAEGIGTFGESNITINAGGDIILRAAQRDTVGHDLPVRIFRRGGGSATSPIYYLSEAGVALEAFITANEDDLTIDIPALQAQLFAMRIYLQDLTPEQGRLVSAHAGRLERVERNSGDIWLMPAPVMGAQDSFAQIGNGGRSTSYLGGLDTIGHRGDITINAGGGIIAEAGDFHAEVGTGSPAADGQFVEIQVFSGAVGTEQGAFVGSQYQTLAHDSVIRVGPAVQVTDPDAIGTVGGAGGTDRRGQQNASLSQRNYVQIGNGGWQARGDHSGDIRIVAGQTAGGVGLRLVAGEGQYDYAQIGNGGFQASGYSPLGVLNSTEALDGDTGNTGDIHVEVDGSIVIEGGGNRRVPGNTGTETGSGNGAVPVVSDNLAAEARIGNGGYEARATHSGDITVISNQGGLDLVGGAGRRASATIGNGGYDARAVDHNGRIFVLANGDIRLLGPVPFIDPFSGMISSTERTNVQIGHGGYAANARSGNFINGPGSGGFHGDIDVISRTGNVLLQGGGDPGLTTNTDVFSMALYVQIGHGGGVNTNGDHRGDIRVVAGNNVEVYGGAGGRDSYTQIGHGGVQILGNLSGDIQVIAGNHLIMNRGADTDTSANRGGAQLYNNWAKIGHGDQRRNQRNDGQGTRNGDIHVSVGHSAILSDPSRRPFSDDAYTLANPDQILIGHIDSRVSASDPFRSVTGDTFIAVSRRNPFSTGQGQLIAHQGATFSSAGEGIFGELRFYLPNPTANLIAEGAMINSSDYTRLPAPDGNRADEHPGTEHGFGLGAYGELTAEFAPVGDYPTQPFGLYNVYYAGAAPLVPPAPRTPSDAPVRTTPGPEQAGFDFLSFFDPNSFDAFARYMALLNYDGYDGLLDGISLEDALEEEGTQRRRAARKVGAAGTTFYVFDPFTNRYSSYVVFGVPHSRLGAAR